MDLITPEVYQIIVKISLFPRLVITTWGTFINVLNIRTFLRMGLEDGVTICFFALALSDFIFMLSGFAYAVVMVADIALMDYGVWVKYPLSYISFNLTIFQNIFLFFTMFATTFLAIQRILCVLLPLRFKDIFTRPRVALALLILFALPASVHITALFAFKLVTLTDKATNRSRYVTIYTSLMAKLIPVTTMGFNICFAATCHFITIACLFILKYALSKSQRFRKAASGVQNGEHDKSSKDKSSLAKNSRERQAIVQVALVCALQIATNLPAFIRNVVSVAFPDFMLYGTYHYTFQTIIVIVMTIELLNAALNFFIYYNCSTRFRSLCFTSNKKV